MSGTPRLTKDQRHAAIILAVRQSFSERGFHGTTTRELARAAGVSEALLFKHFPDKESLFAAMKDDCCAEYARRYERLEALEPSSGTLVLLVHFLVSMLIQDRETSGTHAVTERLLLRSLAEDGEFARHALRPLEAGWVAKVEECVRAARAAGEAADGPVSVPLGAWLAYNLAAMVRFQVLPVPPAVDYGMCRREMTEQAVWFALRGLGLRDETIRRYYHPRALELLG